MPFYCTNKDSILLAFL